MTYYSLHTNFVKHKTKAKYATQKVISVLEFLIDNFFVDFVTCIFKKSSASSCQTMCPFSC
jgi:hypothetical protein